MPIMDCFEEFFKIKKFDPNARVVLITAYSVDEKKHLKAKSMALIDTINKPYSFDQLEEIISKFS